MRVGIGHDLGSLAPVLARHFASQDLISTTTARQGAAMELSYTVSMAPGATPGAAIAALNATPGVQQVDLIRI